MSFYILLSLIRCQQDLSLRVNHYFTFHIHFLYTLLILNRRHYKIFSWLEFIKHIKYFNHFSVITL